MVNVSRINSQICQAGCAVEIYGKDGDPSQGGLVDKSKEKVTEGFWVKASGRQLATTAQLQ